MKARTVAAIWPCLGRTGPLGPVGSDHREDGDKVDALARGHAAIDHPSIVKQIPGHRHSGEDGVTAQAGLR